MNSLTLICKPLWLRVLAYPTGYTAVSRINQLCRRPAPLTAGIRVDRDAAGGMVGYYLFQSHVHPIPCVWRRLPQE